MALLYGFAWRLTVKNGGPRPGQFNAALVLLEEAVLPAAGGREVTGRTGLLLT